MSEWFKEPVLKTGVRETVPWVRIPPLPPSAHQFLRTSRASGIRSSLVEHHAAWQLKTVSAWACLHAAGDFEPHLPLRASNGHYFGEEPISEYETVYRTHHIYRNACVFKGIYNPIVL